MGPSLPLLRRAALVLLMVAVAACAPPLEHGDRAVHYGGIDELVASADAVVLGRVVQTSRGRVLDQHDAVFTIMDVQVAVERVWVGRMPRPGFTIEQPGWERVARRPGWRGWFDRAGEREWRLEGELRLDEGDRGIFFLSRGQDPPGWGVLGPRGPLPGRRRGAGRHRPLGPDGTEGRAADRGAAGGRRRDRHSRQAWWPAAGHLRVARHPEVPGCRTGRMAPCAVSPARTIL